ncbi:MAG: deoxyguanosinetriphosphate triphosphohydrolase [Oscillospiraceae bacterium]|jgi:dGTPase|nr:deoxyguanosinetriphosphate triphosphohydrolase [Oscillospiraceae bacterium]
MPLPREISEARERATLSPRAVLSAESRGRAVAETECDVRTAFQRDTDRITHSKSFRRLIHKTQVFLKPEGDHYRTRLTHTLEVSRVARTIARAAGLNEDLTEAIALGHDLGHTPFGHAGERALDDIMHRFGGFRHNQQSLRVVERVEKDGRGLNLTFETRDGIVNHPRSGNPATLEGRVVQLSDRLTYVNHDADDAVRAGIFAAEDIPDDISLVLGNRGSERIDTLVRDVITHFSQSGEIALSEPVAPAFDAFYSFLNDSLYHNPRAKGEETKVFGILNALFGYYANNPDFLPPEFFVISATDGIERAVCDYIAGMTDGYALKIYDELFIPNAWAVN